jgi:hypothetical protein
MKTDDFDALLVKELSEDQLYNTVGGAHDIFYFVGWIFGVSSRMYIDSPDAMYYATCMGH